MKNIVPVGLLATVVVMGYLRCDALHMVIAFGVLICVSLLCNPFRLLDFLPFRFRLSVVMTIIISSLAISVSMDIWIRGGLFVIAALWMIIAVNRRKDWKTIEYIHQSPEVDNILAEIGHDVHGPAWDIWIRHGRSESRALIHQVAGIEESERKLDACHAPVFCLGYLHGLKTSAGYAEKLHAAEAARLDAISETAAIRAEAEKAKQENLFFREREGDADRIAADLKHTHGRIKELEGLLEEADAKIAELSAGEPEEEIPEPKSMRNLRILREHDAGASYDVLAKKYGLSKSGVRFAISQAQNAG